MDEKDLKQIRELFREEFKTGFQEGFGQIWEGNLEPAFNSVHEKLDAFDERLIIVERKLDKALYMETERITKLESKMKVIEEKLGIKS